MMSRVKLNIRLWILAVFLCIGFSVSMFLPESGEIRPSLLNINLPESLMDWKGEKVKISQRERDVLAKDTEFVRKVYRNSNLQNHLGVEVSLVFSGKDMNNSIHRPEVCLRAQGWNLVNEEHLKVNVDIEGHKVISMKRIVCEKLVYDSEGPVIGANGKHLELRRIPLDILSVLVLI